MTTPTLFVVLVLAAAAARTTRLVGWDTVSERFRRYATGWTDDGLRDELRPNRQGLRTWLSCPWCAGFWHAAAWYAAYQLVGMSVVAVAGLFAVSELVGLVVKHLDQ